MHKGQSLRSQDFYRPYCVNGAEIVDVIIYSEVGVLLNSSRWLQDGQGQDITFIGELDIDNLPRRRVVNLSRKEHFTLHAGALGVDLYLYAPALGWDGEGPYEVINRLVEEELIYHKLHLVFTRKPDGEPEPVTIKTPIPVERRRTEAGARVKELRLIIDAMKITDHSYTMVDRLVLLSEKELESFFQEIRSVRQAIASRKAELGHKS